MPSRLVLAALALAILPHSGGLLRAQNHFDSPLLLDTDASILAVGDVSGDGNPDLVRRVQGKWEILENDGAGAFAPSASGDLNNQSANLTPARLVDMTGDGRLDLVVQVTQTGFNGGIAVHLGVPGGFAPSVYVPTGAIPTDLDFGDFNGDGRVDCAFTRINSSDIGWLFYTGTQFQLSPSVAVGSTARRIAVADIDGDGDADAIAGLQTQSSVVLVTSVGGVPTLGATIDVGGSPSSYTHVNACDLDADGDLDIAALAPNGADLVFTALENAASGSGLIAKPSQTLPGLANAMDWSRSDYADWDADGREELIGHDGSNAVWIRNAGGYALDAPIESPTSTVSSEVVGVVDIDGDGAVDLVTQSSVVFGTGEIQEQLSDFVACCVAFDLMRTKDVDGDGDLDIRSGTTQLLNDATGVFSSPQFLLPTPPDNYFYGASLANGDFDGDHHLDAVVPRFFQAGAAPPVFEGMRLLLNPGNDLSLIDVGPAVAPDQPIGGPTTPNQFVADFDDDGDLDIMANGLVWRNNGTGAALSFQQAGGFLPGITQDVADVDGDGDTDVLTRTTASDLTLYRKVSATGYTPEPILTAAGLVTATESRLIDVDGDGDLDIVAPVDLGVAHEVKVVENLGGGAWAAPIGLTTGLVSTEVFGAADVDGDGSPDFLAASRENDGAVVEDLPLAPVFVFYSNGAGVTFGESSVYLARRPRLFDDFDSDGDVDIVGESIVKSRRFSSPTAGEIRQFGTGTPGDGGAVPLVGAKGPAKAGNAGFQLRLRRNLAGSPTLILIGTQEGLLPNAPVPGATTYTAGTLFVLSTIVPGDLDLGAALPTSAIGVQFVIQTWHADPSAAFSVSTSNGLSVQIGS